MKILKILLGIVVALVLVGAGGLVYLAQSSKDGSAAGLTGATLSPCPASPNCVSSEAGTPAEKAVAPLALASWDALPRVIADLGGTVTVQEDSYIAAEFSTATLGFVDDLELRLGDDAVHVRSASRVGYGDGGVNAARVAELRTKLGG